MLWLVNHEKLAQTTDKAATAGITARLIRSKVQQTPSDLCDWVLARLIPHGDRCWIIIVIERYGSTIETNQQVLAVWHAQSCRRAKPSCIHLKWYVWVTPIALEKAACRRKIENVLVIRVKFKVKCIRHILVQVHHPRELKIDGVIFEQFKSATNGQVHIKVTDLVRLVLLDFHDGPGRDHTKFIHSTNLSRARTNFIYKLKSPDRREMLVSL